MSNKPENTLCPLCNARMVPRKSKSSNNRVFWGCSNFPNCKGTRNTDGEARQEYKDNSMMSADEHKAFKGTTFRRIK